MIWTWTLDTGRVKTWHPWMCHDFLQTWRMANWVVQGATGSWKSNGSSLWPFCNSGLEHWPKCCWPLWHCCDTELSWKTLTTWAAARNSWRWHCYSLKTNMQTRKANMQTRAKYLWEMLSSLRAGIQTMLSTVEVEAIRGKLSKLDLSQFHFEYKRLPTFSLFLILCQTNDDG